MQIEIKSRNKINYSLPTLSSSMHGVLLVGGEFVAECYNGVKNFLEIDVT